MAHTMTRPALSYLDTAAPLPVTAEIALRVAVVMTQWAERSRTRRALRGMDDHILRDIGITRHQARIEAGKPFYRP